MADGPPFRHYTKATVIKTTPSLPSFYWIFSERPNFDLRPLRRTSLQSEINGNRTLDEENLHCPSSFRALHFNGAK